MKVDKDDELNAKIIEHAMKEARLFVAKTDNHQNNSGVSPAMALAVQLKKYLK